MRDEFKGQNEPNFLIKKIMPLLKIPGDWGDRGSILCFNVASAIFNLLPSADAYRLGHQLVRL